MKLNQGGQQYIGDWTTRVAQTNTSFIMVIRASDGKLVVQPSLTPQSVQCGLSGSLRPVGGPAAPQPISQAAVELRSPVIEASPQKVVRVKGTGTTQPAANVLPLQHMGAK